MPTMNELQVLQSIDRKLSALISLLADLRQRTAEQGDKSAPKVEALLHKAGLSSPEIANLIGKDPQAVRKAIQRSRR
jgi:IS30 family transposase